MLNLTPRKTKKRKIKKVKKREPVEAELPKKRKKVKKRRGKPGLLFSTTKIEIEQVKKAHKKPCSVCEESPVDRRLVVTEGSARAQAKKIFCINCGLAFLGKLSREVGRAQDYLAIGGCSGDGFVRLPAQWKPDND